MRIRLLAAFTLPLLLLATSRANAQTIFLLAADDTYDPEIGRSVEIDLGSIQ